ncbi:MAG: hypothetical protein JJ900_02655 [Rhodospirillales bacterium]|nr:hypothetical protein [Rhodospirillales bacterium]MBO6785723.1 hypothetical protein [Rhodospirillales bacterium]
MPELTLSPVHALAHVPVGRFGAAENASPLALTALAEGTILQILGAAPDSIAPALAEFGNFVIRPNAPAQWLAISDKPLSSSELTQIDAALTGKADVIDQSAGRIRIQIEGPDVRAALAKGVAVDLHHDVFELGQSVTTLCGHITVNITRTGDDQFELLVMRTYAVDLWESLTEMVLEHGIECRHA